MPKVKLSKSALQVQRTQLQLFKRLLPSLDMKRRQLTLEHERAKTEHAQARRTVDELETNIGRELPMLAGAEMDLSGLVRLKQCVLSEENVVGVRLPVLKAIEVEVADYSMMARPAWVDHLVTRLRLAAEQRMRVEVAGRRLAILGKSMRQITQRVNLFERILIPQAKANIRRIRIFLGDLERDSVVRSKLAKSRGIAGIVEDAT
jgi:V/A-type H+/Na+-transporting ATPase subunit D